MRKLQWMVALAIVLLPIQASAWECGFASCPVVCDLPVTYAIGDLPAGVDETEGIAEIQRAVEAWDAPSCVDLQFQYLGRAADLGGTSASIIVGVVPWSDTLGGATSWAVSMPVATNQGCLVPATEPNVALNDDDFAWSTDGTADFVTTVDLYTAVLGRVGSSLGIANSFDGNSVVASTVSAPATTGILSADEDAICFLYGDGTVGPNGVTGPRVPEGCTECTTDDECDAKELCMPIGGGVSLCQVPCDSGETCPGESECIETGVEAVPNTCMVVTDGTVSMCPDPNAPPIDADMGAGAPDMGSSAADVGTTEPDLGGHPIDPDSNEEKGCSTTGSAPLGPGVLLLIGLVVRRRR